MYPIIIFFLILIILYECIKFNEKFQTQTSLKPSPIKLSGNTKNGIISIFWSQPKINNDNIIEYIVYVQKKGDKDKRIISQKKGDSPFYKKKFLDLEKNIEYTFNVVSVTQTTISDKSNDIKLKTDISNIYSRVPLSKLTKKISCNPDGTYESSQSCKNNIYPNIEDINEIENKELLQYLHNNNNQIFRL